MSSIIQNSYIPDYLVAPGEVLQDYLNDISMTQAELADRTGLAKKTINEIIKAKSSITPETALKLERVLGRPSHFWSNLERQYQDDLMRLGDQARMDSCLEWLQRVPVSAMAKWGWIPKLRNKREQLDAVLRFYGVASPDQWKRVWLGYQVAYRQTQRFDKCEEAVSAWLRQGEIEAQQIECRSFNRKLFLEVLDKARALTIETPDIFQPELVASCASAGVAVVFVPELPGTGTWGATRWLGDRAVIQLSLRYKSNDHLWFTFFHEAGHILKHGHKVIVETSGRNDEKEKEANMFAKDKLIPPTALRQFLQCRKPTLDEIKKFAQELGIAPGIIVGRLQHEGILPRNIGNKLKVFYTWEKSASL